MWTKDYLVRGFARRRKRDRRFWYEKRSWLNGDKEWTPHDEWQALYRVEEARRWLKRARAKVEAQRQLVLSMDAETVRAAVVQAQWDAGFVRRQEEQHRQRAMAWAQRKALRQEQFPLLPELKGRDRVLRILAWRLEGWTYRRIGEVLEISPDRVRQIELQERHRRLRLFGNWPWYLKRTNLGRPLDIDANQDDYRGKWLYGDETTERPD